MNVTVTHCGLEFNTVIKKLFYSLCSQNPSLTSVYLSQVVNNGYLSVSLMTVMRYAPFVCVCCVMHAFMVLVHYNSACSL